jgi:translation initiation factor 2 subunit 1
METKKSEWPEIGELVIGTVKRIVPYGAYVTLDEYNDKEGLLHISEVASTWIRNIRNHVREGQKVVLKSLRVDAQKGHVDLSLRQVSGRERKTKMLRWKREKRAKGILKMIADRHNMTFEEIYEKVGLRMEDQFGGLYDGFVESAEKGEKVLLDAGIQDKYAKDITVEAKSKIKVPRVEVRGILELSNTKPNGAEILREAFMKAKKTKKPRNVSVKFYVVGSPKYRVEVTARNYKEAERVLERAVETTIQTLESNGGQGSFKRL